MHPVSDLSMYLAARQRVWTRVGASRLDGDWQLSLLEVTVDEAPPSWRESRGVSSPVRGTIGRWPIR
jgi:hypothetical protein